jgi:hypothetical protein
MTSLLDVQFIQFVKKTNEDMETKTYKANCLCFLE